MSVNIVIVECSWKLNLYIELQRCQCDFVRFTNNQSSWLIHSPQTEHNVLLTRSYHKSSDAMACGRIGHKYLRYNSGKRKIPSHHSQILWQTHSLVEKEWTQRLTYLHQLFQPKEYVWWKPAEIFGLWPSLHRCKAIVPHFHIDLSILCQELAH